MNTENRKEVPFARPDVGDAERRAVDAVIDSGWLTTGAKTQEFGEAFAGAVGAVYGVPVSSCTAALHLALDALGIGRGDEVIVPAMTFTATGEVVAYMGARPVLVDIRTEDHNMDPEAVERAVGPRTRAVIPVHFGGQACEMDVLLDIARRHGLHVVEDAAHAFPAAYKGRKVGVIGDITCFSFYATKTITTGEGGMATTDNVQWAERMRIMSLHGMSRDAWKRYSGTGTWYYEVVAPGYKYNLTDIASALGLVQLGRVEEMLTRRREIAAAFQLAFEPNDALELLEVRNPQEHAWHLFVIKLVPGALTIGRDRLIEELKALGVNTSVHFIPLHLHPYYRETYGYGPGSFPVATDCYERSVSLPIYSRMSDGDVDWVVEAVGDVTRRFKR